MVKKIKESKIKENFFLGGHRLTLSGSLGLYKEHLWLIIGYIMFILGPPSGGQGSLYLCTVTIILVLLDVGIIHSGIFGLVKSNFSL